MGEVMEMELDKKWKHRLFHCAGYWKFWRPYPFHCPLCNRGYRCYWDGGDANGLINLCYRCYPHQHALERQKQVQVNDLANLSLDAKKHAAYPPNQGGV